MLQYPQCLNMPQYVLMSLNIPECPWRCLKMSELAVLNMPGFSMKLIILDIWKGFQYATENKCARVLNISRYSYNNPIIVVANVIILKFLSARFVDPGAPQLTILFLLTRVRT